METRCVKCENFVKETNDKGWKIFRCTKCETKCWLAGIPENETLIECCSQFKEKK